ncbi:desulfoferrodoxin [Candidatus Parcubacteria bacterium]|nr:desulfoferrodoxin [Candidatus Parcubacteria bacterium]
MTQQNQIYKCEICGNIVEVLHTGVGELVCCGQPMKLKEEKTEEEGYEKHAPVIEELPPNVCQGKDGVKIKIGETEHPMDADHYIEWIEIIPTDSKRGKRFLKPGDKPEAEFYTRKTVIGARAYCNIHGLWKLENKKEQG